MSSAFVITLLLLALVLPVVGAIGLRLLAARLSERRLYGAAMLIFGIAIASVLLLARSRIDSIQIGSLSLLLPVAALSEDDLNLPQLTVQPAPDENATTSGPTELSTSAPTAAPSVTPGSAPTDAPTAAPTAALIEVPTAPPTAVPTEAPTAPPAAPARRTYTVVSGDTLRSIAEQFNVSVQVLLDANNLTPEQADSLRVGQELVIP